MLSGRTAQRIRSFKAVRSFHPHLPILARAGSGDGHSPVASSVGKRVFDSRSNFPAQLSIAEILQFDCHPFHCILSPEALPIRGANRSKLSATGSRTHHEHAYSQFVLKPRGNATKKTGACDVEPRRPKKQVRLRAIPTPKNGKGCDIGYAPATSSCEGANRVDACTVAALDAITAFAVPNPNCFSQKQSVFSGPVALQVALPSRSLSLLRKGKFYFANPFSRRRGPS